MENGMYIGIKSANGTQATHVSEEVMEIEALRKKLKKNSDLREAERKKLEEERMAQRAEYMAKMDEMEREKQARIRAYENRKAKTLAIVKRSVVCLMVISLFWLFMWFDQCKISVFLTVSVACLVHLAYYSGTWRLEVFQ